MGHPKPSTKPGAIQHSERLGEIVSLRHRIELDKKAKRAGYYDLVDALESNTHMSNAALGRLLMVSELTIARHKKKLKTS